MKIIIFGATGFIGKDLTTKLKNRGHQVVGADLRHSPNWQRELETSDAVVNLAGAPIVGKRWSDSVKKELRASRVEGTRKIVEAINRLSRRPAVLVNASAVGYYGWTHDEILSESAPAGHDFLAELCRDWESEAGLAKIRSVVIRTGIVLGKNGGALKKMTPLFKFFAGGPVGDGMQWMSWIHIDDITEIYLTAIEREDFNGPLNATAPRPVRNSDFVKILGHVLQRPSHLRTPAFALKLVLGEVADTLTHGQRVLPQVLLDHGYKFKFPELAPALENVLL